MYPGHQQNLQNDNSQSMHQVPQMSHQHHHQTQNDQMDKISYRGIFTTTDTPSSMLTSKLDIDMGRQLNSPQMSVLPDQMSPPSAALNGWNLPSPDKTLFQPPLFSLLGTPGKYSISFSSFYTYLLLLNVRFMEKIIFATFQMQNNNV